MVIIELNVFTLFKKNMKKKKFNFIVLMHDKK